MSAILLPSVQVVYPNNSTQYRCAVFAQKTITRLEWLINGSLLSDLSLDNFMILKATNPSGIIGGDLLFFDIPLEHNMTTIHCRAIISTTNQITSMMSVLLVQGELDTKCKECHYS